MYVTCMCCRVTVTVGVPFVDEQPAGGDNAEEPTRGGQVQDGEDGGADERHHRAQPARSQSL